MKLPTDKALVDDPKFRPVVELYAKDEETFFHHYAASHKKLSELGFTAPPPAKPDTKMRNLPQGAVGVAIVVAVAIICYLFEVHNKV